MNDINVEEIIDKYNKDNNNSNDDENIKNDDNKDKYNELKKYVEEYINIMDKVCLKF